MQALALFTPEDELETWRVRLFPWPAPCPVAGLSELGEAGGLCRPDFATLDDRMAAARAGYHRRVHSSGIMEVTATGRGAEALCNWVGELLKARRLNQSSA